MCDKHHDFNVKQGTCDRRSKSVIISHAIIYIYKIIIIFFTLSFNNEINMEADAKKDQSQKTVMM